MTADVLDLARGGDGDAFRQLIEPYERELQVHRYRMLGSAQDAEDAMQEALLRPGRDWAASRDVPRSGPGFTGSSPPAA